MAEITRSNYQKELPDILNKMKDATFVSFDAEFSGLGQPPGESKTSLFDTGADRYEKMKKIVQQNTTPQIGFCVFHKDPSEDTNIFNVEGFQAYVSEPRFADFNNENSIALSLEYKCGKFLRKCNFDFNAHLEKSVPYLNDARKNELVHYLEENADFRMKNPNRYFDKNFFPETDKDKPYNEDEKLEIVERLRGLAKIVDVIRENRIPLVGHNVALDLMYYFQMFCNDLPDTYEAFKQSIVQYIPHIYDTKLMILSCRKMLQSHPAFKNNQDKDKLESSSLYTAFQNTSGFNDKFAPKIKLGSTCTHFEKSLHSGRNVDLEVEKNELVHSPAFDACTTGALFLNMSHIAARIDKNFQEREHPPTPSELFLNVQSWKDQVFISRAAVMSMYMSGNDPKPCRPRWTECKSTKKIEFDQLKLELSKFGPVDIKQIDDQTLRFAAAGGKSARQIKTLLTEKGYVVKNVEIPYNKSKYLVSGVSGNSKCDNVYDRSKLLG